MALQIAFYKGTPAGIRGLYNRLVRWWSDSLYSHVELVFSDGLMASASFMDKGVRFKSASELNPEHWDIFTLPDSFEHDARKWFDDHNGDPYDLLTQFHFIFGPVKNDKSKWFCSEAVGAALGIPESWQFSPGILALALKLIK